MTQSPNRNSLRTKYINLDFAFNWEIQVTCVRLETSLLFLACWPHPQGSTVARREQNTSQGFKNTSQGFKNTSQNPKTLLRIQKHFPESKILPRIQKQFPESKHVLDSGKYFGFFDVFLVFGACFGFLDVFLDSWTCFGFCEVFWSVLSPWATVPRCLLIVTTWHWVQRTPTGLRHQA